MVEKYLDEIDDKHILKKKNYLYRPKKYNNIFLNVFNSKNNCY